MSTDPFTAQLAAIRQRMRDLATRTGTAPTQDEVLPEMLEHLGTALEELDVTGEELRQQTEELLRVQQAAEAERHRYQSLFDTAPEGCLVTDEEGVIQEANRAAAELLGVRQDSLVGKPLVLFVTPPDRTAFLRHLGQPSQDGQPAPEWQVSLEPRNVRAVPALLTSHRVRTFSGICSLRWTLRAASGRGPTPGPPEHEQLLDSLERVTARAAHHLNTELAVIQGQAEVLGTPALPPAFRAPLEALQAAATTATELVRRIQTFSRLRPGAPPEPTELAPIVLQALAATRLQQQSRAIALCTDLGGVPPVLGHEVEIREACIHLILNAVDAMPKGGLLSIHARSAGSDLASGRPTPRWVALTVTDTGVGMSDEVRQHLFEPFFTTKGVERAGLGLAMVHGIMRRHLGSVEVTSDPGRGCAVTLWFPAASPGATACQAGGRDGLRVLVIDDHATVRRTVAELLRRRGLVVAEAAGGAEGLARLAEAPADLVITDLQMPGMNGWEVARAVRFRAPNVPVIVLTGSGEKAPGSEKGGCPADRVVAKPITRDTLLALIAELVPSRHERVGE